MKKTISSFLVLSLAILCFYFGFSVFHNISDRFERIHYVSLRTELYLEELLHRTPPVLKENGIVEFQDGKQFKFSTLSNAWIECRSGWTAASLKNHFILFQDPDTEPPETNKVITGWTATSSIVPK